MNNRVRDIRVLRRISQVELAKQAGISRHTLSDVENNVRSTVKFSTLEAIARALELPVSELFLS